MSKYEEIILGSLHKEIKKILAWMVKQAHILINV